jgi:hypothetical protein
MCNEICHILGSGSFQPRPRADFNVGIIKQGPRKMIEFVYFIKKRPVADQLLALSLCQRTCQFPTKL